jgi:predicted ferric reductase
MGGLLLFSLPPFRRKVFEFFYRTHWILFIGVAVFGLIHGATVGVLGFVGNIIDFILRKIIINRNKKNSVEVLAVRLPANVVRITFKKDSFNYKAGQYSFICVPELSYLEWHPFSLSSSPHQDTVTLHVRVLGDWTNRLATIVGTTEKKLVILIDGPYGNPSIDIDSDKYKIFLMISGGIGITPLQSMTNELLEQHSRGRPLKKIFFVWSIRDHFMISDVQSHDVKYLENNLPKQLPYSF